MFVPLVTPISQRLYRRKGGGGGGKGGGGDGGGDDGGGSSSGSSGSGSTSGRSSGTPESVPLTGSAATGGKTSAVAYGSGGFPEQTIPQGQFFAGRSQGGGVRSEVFGTRYVQRE